MDNIVQHKVISGYDVFGDDLLDSKTFYLYHFNALPNIHMLRGVDGIKAFAAIKEKYAGKIKHIYQHHELYTRSKKYELDEALIVFDNHCMLEVSYAYCEILHGPDSDDFVADLTKIARRFRKPQKRQPYEINLIVRGHEGRLALRSMEFKKTKLDLDLYYEDDFKTIDQLIFNRLNTKSDKGIVLLHGMPGTGKTTYLRYLIGRLKKRVLFLSPSLAHGLMQPDFLELLIQNPDTILVIEDAENIVMDRKLTGDSVVSNLLNLSDGLLSDCINVQVICTFNSELSLIDSALLRKGRLIARYEFGKLSVAKAQHLSDKKGFKSVIRQPMTLAEVINQHEQTFEKAKTPVIGFSVTV